MAGGRGPVDRGRVVAFLQRVGVQAAREEQVHDIQVPGRRRQVQQRLLVRRRAQVQPVGVSIEQGGEPARVASASRLDCARVHGIRIGVIRHELQTGEKR